MPADPKSSIATYLQRRGVGLGHVRSTDDPWGLEEWSHADVEELEREPSKAPFELDDRSFARWVQSVLRAAVEPSLIIDGRIGTRTRLAIQRFQANALSLGVRGSELPVTGTLDATTLAAMQAVAGVRSPGGSPIELNADGQQTFVAGDYLLSRLVHTPTDSGVSEQEGSVVALGGEDVRILVDGRSRSIIGRVPLALKAAKPAGPGGAPGSGSNAPSAPAPSTPAPAPGGGPILAEPTLLHDVKPLHLATTATPIGGIKAVAIHAITAHDAQPVVLSKPKKMVVAHEVKPVLLASEAKPLLFTKSLSRGTLSLSAEVLKAKPVAMGSMVVKMKGPVAKKAGPKMRKTSKTKTAKWYLSDVLAKDKKHWLEIDKDALIRALDRSIRERFVGIGDDDEPTPTPPDSGDRPVDETPSDAVVDSTDTDATETEPTDANTPQAPPTMPLADTSSFAHWVQSILARTVEPDIAIDGIIGPITRSNIGLFQRSLPTLPGGLEALPDTGATDPDTIGALEWVSGTKRPDRPEFAVEDTPPPPVGDWEAAVATEELSSSGKLWNVVRMSGDEVRFQYHVKDRPVPGGDTDHDPYNVWSYDGAKTDLLSDADIASEGYSWSAAKILRENALKESGGKFGAVNTWDNQYVSWGLSQFAGHAGTLATLLASLQEHSQSRSEFERCFLANGIDVAHGPYPYWDRSLGAFRSRNGYHVVVHAGDVHLGDIAWLYLRTQPRLVGSLMLAGNSKALQIGQIRFWREKFLDNCRRKSVLERGHSFSTYVTSELGVGLAARLYNWMPTYLRKWMREIVADMASDFPGVDLHDPASWEANPEIETLWIAKMRTKRRNAKQGDWDDYGLTLSAQRGTYR